MKSPSLADKIAYFAKVREANYAASLRLEGFCTPQQAACEPEGSATDGTTVTPSRRGGAGSTMSFTKEMCPCPNGYDALLSQ